MVRFVVEHGVKFDLSDTPERDGPIISMRGATPDSTASCRSVPAATSWVAATSC